jgi:hypothetical protein
LIRTQPSLPHFSWLWKSFCESKHKFFFWILLNDILNTINLVGRKKWCYNPTIVLPWIVLEKKLFNTFSGRALLQIDVGTSYALTDKKNLLVQESF